MTVISYFKILSQHLPGKYGTENVEPELQLLAGGGEVLRGGGILSFAPLEFLNFN